MTKGKKIAAITTGVLVLAGIGVTIYLYRVSTAERAARKHQAEVDKPMLNPYA